MILSFVLSKFWIHPCLYYNYLNFSIDGPIDKEPKIFDICNSLANYNYKWRSIGEGLEVRDGDLSSIECNKSDDGEKLAAVLRKWKESCCSPYTWRNICNVLKAPAINLIKPAEDICKSLSEGGDLYEKYI